MLFALPAAHVGPDLGDDLHRSLRTDAVDLAQVGAAGEPLQGAAEIELGLMLRDGPVSGRRQRGGRWRLLRGQRS